MGSLHRIQHKHTRKMSMPCCQICEWGLLKRKQCYIHAKETKMPTFTTRKNQHKNGNDVQDNPPPYSHTISNVPYSCNHQNNKRPWPKMFNIPFSRISSHQYPYYPSAIRTWNSLPAVLISVRTLGAFKWRCLMYMCRHSHHSFYCIYYILTSVFYHILPCQRMYIAQVR